MNENKKAEVKVEEKKENLIKKTGKKVGAFFKKAWPWLAGGTIGGTLVFAYLLLKDDEKMSETETEVSAE